MILIISKIFICQKTFGSILSLRGHVTRHHQEKKFHQCNECEKKYSTKHHLKRHVDSIHRNKSHKCDFCTKSYTMKDTLNDHIKDFHGGRLHNCKICEKAYPRRSSLTSHMKSIHKNDITNRESVKKSKVVQDFKSPMKHIP